MTGVRRLDSAAVAVLAVCATTTASASAALYKIVLSNAVYREKRRRQLRNWLKSEDLVHLRHGYGRSHGTENQRATI